MITVRTNLKAVFVKKQELLQTLQELQPLIRSEPGCLHISVSENVRNADTIMVHTEWSCPEDALAFFRSDYFRIFMGAVKILTQSSEIRFSGKSLAEGIDIKKIRGAGEFYSLAEKILSGMNRIS